VAGLEAAKESLKEVRAVYNTHCCENGWLPGI
jgi:hypothetical protein